jgi:hypothetical protein
MIIINVFKRLLSHSRKTRAMRENNLISSISILEISVEAHHQVPCEHPSMGRTITNGRPYRSRAKTDVQKSSEIDEFACLPATNIARAQKAISSLDFSGCKRQITAWWAAVGGFQASEKHEILWQNRLPHFDQLVDYQEKRSNEFEIREVGVDFQLV